MEPYETKHDQHGNVKVNVVDRRSSVIGAEAADAAQDERPAYVQELEARTRRAEERLKERLEELDRENTAYRERMQRDLERRVNDRLIPVLAPVFDMLLDLDRLLSLAPAGDKVAEGAHLMRDKVLTGLAKEGIATIAPAPGDALDPNCMEACGLTPADGVASGCVTSLLQRGFALGDRVVSPARVTVAP